MRPAQDIEADLACPLDLNEPPVVSVFECTFVASLVDAADDDVPIFEVLEVVLLLFLLRLVFS